MAEVTGAVTGRVTSALEGALPQMVVYLEAVDPSRDFPPPDAPAVISQRGAKFSPSLLVVCVGQSVEFRNDEDRPIEHNVFSHSPVKPFDLGLYRPGLSKSVTFDKPGAVRLYCSVHRYMDGVIYVTPTPLATQVESDGRYRIDGVPEGAYRLQTWQRRRRFRDEAVGVTITPGETVVVNLEMRRK